MHTLDWVTWNDEPMRRVTASGVTKWKDAGEPFKVEYDLMEFTAKGLPLYRCRYAKSGVDTPYVFVKPPEGRESIGVTKLGGLGGVEAHQETFGDGRRVILQEDGSIRSISST